MVLDNITRRAVLKGTVAAGGSVTAAGGSLTVADRFVGSNDDGESEATISIEVWFSEDAPTDHYEDVVKPTVEDMVAQIPDVSVSWNGMHDTSTTFTGSKTEMKADLEREYGLTDDAINVVVHRDTAVVEPQDEFPWATVDPENVKPIVDHSGEYPPGEGGDPAFVVLSSITNDLSTALYRNMIITGIARPILGSLEDEYRPGERVNSFGTIYGADSAAPEISPLATLHVPAVPLEEESTACTNLNRLDDLTDTVTSLCGYCGPGQTRPCWHVQELSACTIAGVRRGFELTDDIVVDINDLQEAADGGYGYLDGFIDIAASTDSISCPAPETVTPTDSTGANGTDTPGDGGTPTNEPPVPEIVLTPESPDAGETITFDGSHSSDSDGDSLEYEWRLVDATSTIAIETTESFSTSLDAGEYTVRLEVTDEHGRSVDTGRTVAVGGEVPEAVIEWSPNPPAPGEDVTLDGSASTDPDGGSLEYVWYGEPGGTSFRQIGTGPQTTANVANFDRFKLAVTDDEDQRSVAIANVQPNHPPSASVSISPSSPDDGDTVTFDGTASGDRDGDDLDYRWDVRGSGTAELDNSETFSTTLAAGEYAVELEVTDEHGSTDTTTTSLTVSSFSVSIDKQETAQGGQYELTALPSNGETPVTYEWRIVDTRNGDEWPLEGKEVEWYGNTGNYRVYLTATDASGTEATAEDSIHVV